MLSVYAAWTEGAVEADITAIRDAMNRKGGGGARRKTAADGPGTETPTSTMVGLATSRPDRRTRARRTESSGTTSRPEGDLAVAGRRGVVSRWKLKKILVEREGLEPSTPAL